MTTPRPIAMLIAALGGEGGGVLTDWIVAAAGAQGLPVQSTSIPGVAQRTGATTYYIEVMPATLAALGGKRPVLALTPSGGDVDVVLASELMEGARAIRHDGKAVDANLRGFRAGVAAATAATARAAHDGKRRHGAVRSVAALEAEANAIMPASAIEIVVEGLRRTAAYQDAGYAGLYFDRLTAICEADDRADAGGRLIRETARQLAVRMTFEDVVRVAEAKIAPERFARIRAELGLEDGEPFRIV